MIYVELGGRLGNQLFRYAFARALDVARNLDDEIVIGGSSYLDRESADGFRNNLTDFNTKTFRQINDSIFAFYPLWLSCIYRGCCQIKKIMKYDSSIFEKKYKSFFSRMGILNAHFENYDFDIPFRKQIFLDGDFQDPKYFKDIRNILLKEFQPKYPPLKANLALYKILKEQNTVCVHVRRGDYLSDKYKKDFFVCDKDYYDEAIRLIFERIENPVFFFFSNDIEWVKRNFKLSVPCYYEPSYNPLWESFRMMYSCKNFIISNSTLSWWGQYMSTNPNKLVISPDHWFNNLEMSRMAKLIQPSFVKIKCKFYR